MLIREMKSDMCLCNTPVHTGAFLIGLLTFVLEIISILFEISSHTDDDNQPINATELDNDHLKTFEYAGYYADKIVVGSGLLRHIIYYIIHIAGLIASALLIYGNKTSKPRLYLPFIFMTIVEIVVAGVESILFLVAIIGIKSGAYTEIPSEPALIRFDVVMILVSAIFLEIIAIVVSLYFLWIVWRDKTNMEEYGSRPFDNNYTVSYTNQASDANQAGTSTPLPNVPATYRI